VVSKELTQQKLGLCK